MNTTQKGDLSLAMIIARLLQNGVTVLKPVSEAHRYDLVIERGGGFERIQCKTGRLRNGAVVFNTASIDAPHKGGARRSYDGEIEAFGVYCHEVGKCFLVPIDVAPKGAATLRVDDPKNNQKTGVIMARDYEI